MCVRMIIRQREKRKKKLLWSWNSIKTYCWKLPISLHVIWILYDFSPFLYSEVNVSIYLILMFSFLSYYLIQMQRFVYIAPYQFKFTYHFSLYSSSFMLNYFEKKTHFISFRFAIKFLFEFRSIKFN